MKFHEFVEKKENHVLVVANESGTPYNQEVLKSLIKRRPEILHKDGSYYKIDFPPTKALIVNEENDKLSVFDVCDYHNCKEQYKFKDEKGYVEWSDKLLNQSQIINFYVNDPEEFFEQLKNEIEVKQPRKIYAVSLNQRIKSFLKNLNIDLI